VVEYLIYQCTLADCQFRFPVSKKEEAPPACPLCGGKLHTQKVNMPFSQKKDELTSSLRLAALLDNLRSVFNVGSIFRIADGVGVEHLALCGTTATPENPKLRKTALGAEVSVPWSYSRNGVQAAERLRALGYQLWALENDARAEPLRVARAVRHEVEAVALVVGNEVTGIDPQILALCERSFFLPMQGVKSSLNVAVAFGAAVYGLKV